MTFPDESFNVVIDKGTLDALFTDTKDSTVHDIRCYFQEVLRVLSVSGRFICVSLAQQHIAEELIAFFKDSCFVRVHCIEQKKDDLNSNGLGARLPVFVFVLTKLKMKCKNIFFAELHKVGRVENNCK